MLFSSTTFLFLFLPILCFVYLLAKKKFHNSILLIASFIFYGWNEPSYLAIMIMTILINYTGAIAITSYESFKKPLLFLSIIANLGFLFYFKYFNFVLENINGIFSANVDFIEVIMPIGISFYTFQAMSYLIDVYRGDTKVQKDIYKLSLYISLFPQLVAGPIVKYKDIEAQIDDRSVTFDKVSYGVKRFIIGLAKKVLIANTLGAVADEIFALPVDQLSVFYTWIGALLYSLQVFFDFSGYSDMAIGLGYIFGFKFLENFNYPYISRSISEFWSRWHISLSTWFKQYLYIPLGGNRVPVFRVYLNLFLVFLATGIWHGATWNFVVWGLLNGMFIIFEKLTNWHKEKKQIWQIFMQHIYTILALLLLRVIFRSDDLSYAKDYILKMFNIGGTENATIEAIHIDNMPIIAFVLAILLSMPIFKNILEKSKENKYLRCAMNIWLLSIFLISVSFIAASTYNPFIYFRF